MRSLSVAVVGSFEPVFQLINPLDELLLFYCVDVVILMQLSLDLVPFIQQLLVCLFQTLYSALFIEQDFVEVVDDALQPRYLVLSFLDDHKLSLQALFNLFQVINQRLLVILKLFLLQCHLLLVLLIA